MDKMVIFHCYVSSPEGNGLKFKGTVLSLKLPTQRLRGGYANCAAAYAYA